MLKYVHLVGTLLLTMVCLGCCGYLLWKDRQPQYEPPPPTSEPPHIVEDLLLRRFLGVRSVGGHYELPLSHTVCQVQLLKFENGKYVGWSGSTAGLLDKDRSAMIPIYMMWGPTPTGVRATILMEENTSTNQNDFFAKLDGSILVNNGKQKADTLGPYQVAGYATSESIQPGIDRNTFSENVKSVIHERQSVAVLVFKSFETWDDQHQFDDGLKTGWTP